MRLMLLYILEGDELVLRASRNSHPESVGQVKLKLGQAQPAGSPSIASPWSCRKNAGGDPRFQSSTNSRKIVLKRSSPFPC